MLLGPEKALGWILRGLGWEVTCTHLQEQSSEPAGDLQWAEGMYMGRRPCHSDQGR